MKALSLEDTVGILQGVGPTRQGQLEGLGIYTIRDLLYHVPFRYEKILKVSSIALLETDKLSAFYATVISKIPIRTSKFRSMIKVRVSDDTGNMDLTWFNTPFILSALHVGQPYVFIGKVTEFAGKKTITNPNVQKELSSLGELVPIYHETSEITSRYLKKLILYCLDQCVLEDDKRRVPFYTKRDFPTLKESLTTLHAPIHLDSISHAKKRLAFDEMLDLMVGVMQRKIEHQASKASTRLKASNKDIDSFSKLLPYTLTPSQKEAILAITVDLVSQHPMHRLIQGEVGSGKTTVAAFALWLAASQHAPAFLICPTNILAQQHFSTLSGIFNTSSLKIGLWTGKEKHQDCQILIGTHALFERAKEKPSLVVVDEEHRFGVKQRDIFFATKKKPHFLSMTATPIPRTVAITALSDREMSTITPHKSNENIKTWVVTDQKRAKAYEWINATLQQTKGQALIVCPFIEESTLDTLLSVKSAKQEFSRLTKKFPKYRLELLHGKLKESEKQQVFINVMEGKTNIVVTTPVVEVGVDIPKANIIVIEGAERFGLAQLHQLRGRVGRRGQEAFCLLFTSNETDNTKRLKYFSSMYNGNDLAEYDLKTRGSGELLGIRQHGFDSLRFATWSDRELIEDCRTCTQELLNC